MTRTPSVTAALLPVIAPNPEDVVHNFGEFAPWTAPKINGAPIEIDGYKIKAK
jgi:hypothetical protein